jgi:hypothetical protein
MPKHYLYRMDHDTGYAPRSIEDFWILCGCMKRNVERGARKGSWVIGIGGNGTGKPDALIYAMQVDATLTLEKLSQKYPSESSYLYDWGMAAESPVLVSNQCFYFGKDAPDLPDDLSHLLVGKPRCKLVSDEDTIKLQRFLAEEYRGPGQPNNPPGEVTSCPPFCGDDSGSSDLT